MCTPHNIEFSLYYNNDLCQNIQSSAHTDFNIQSSAHTDFSILASAHTDYL